MNDDVSTVSIETIFWIVAIVLSLSKICECAILALLCRDAAEESAAEHEHENSNSTALLV